MGDNLVTFTSSEPKISRITPPILKISTPVGVYKTKEYKDLYEAITAQVGEHYLPVLVPKDVELEIIDVI